MNGQYFYYQPFGRPSYLNPRNIYGTKRHPYSSIYWSLECASGVGYNHGLLAWFTKNNEMF